MLIFGVALKYIHMTSTDTNSIVKQNQLLLNTHQTKFEGLDIKLSKANGHRYNIAKELKGHR